MKGEKNILPVSLTLPFNVTLHLETVVDSSLQFGFSENQLCFPLPKVAASVRQSLLPVSDLKSASVPSPAPEMLLIAARKKTSEVWDLTLRNLFPNYPW